MEKHTGVRLITLNDLWYVFVSRIWIIFLATVIVVTGYFAFEKMTFEPRYESTATLYILKQDNEKNKDDTLADFSLALNVVNDCDYLLKSHSVIDKVIKDLDLKMSYNQLCGCITTTNPDNTRILKVTVESDSYELSKKIVDKVCKIGAERIEKAMGFKQVNLFEYGIMNSAPINVVGISTYLLLSAIVVVLTYTVFLIAFLFDDKIATDEDVQKYLGLHVIGNIPNFRDHSSNRYKYYKSHNRYISTNDKESGEE